MTKKTSENANELPNGWEWKRLGEIVDFQGGSQPPKSEFSHEHKEGYVKCTP